jgi:DNA (cytosine-5)-methyltransferase 1
MNPFANSPIPLASNQTVELERARALALHLDQYWPKAKIIAPGPIDVIDMFSGCGGMSVGFVAANAVMPLYRLALAVDIDEDSNQTYEANLGLRPLNADVAQLAKDPKTLRRRIAAVRSAAAAPLVMIGCAPCQGFSSHRNANGATDIRNSLFVAFARIAATVKPDIVVVENVPEILTNSYWPLVEQARPVLSRAGYRSITAVHDMAEFGVPQRRFRALMIGMRRKFRMPHGFLSREDFRTGRESIAELPPIEPGQVAVDDPMHVTAGHRSFDY